MRASKAVCASPSLCQRPERRPRSKGQCRAEQTSFLFGANAPFIEELLRALPRRSQRGRRRVAHLLRGAGRPEGRCAGRGARRLLGAQRRAGDRRGRSRDAAGARQPQREGQRQVAPRRGCSRRPAGAARPKPRSAPPAQDTARALTADPRLPHPRPSRGRPRSAGPGQAPGAASRTRSRDLRLRRERLGPSDPDLRLAGPRVNPRPCARSWNACARPIAARSASSSCTSPIPTRRRGSRSASSISRTTPNSPSTGRKMILERVVEAEGLERYLGVKFVGTKRFGLDGGEALIPGIEQILKRGGQLGVPRSDDRHAASRPPQHARARHAQELHRAVLRVPGPLLAARGNARLGRREVSSRRLGRSRVRRQRHPSLAVAQPFASRGGQPRGAGQGARQGRPARRHRPQPGHVRS